MATHTKYTEEHIQFLREYSPTHTIEQTWEAFFDKFEMDINKTTISYLLKKHNIPYVKCKDMQNHDIHSRGERGAKYKKKFRRTKIAGTESSLNLMNDVCSSFDMKKYEYCEQAFKRFVKNEEKISGRIKSGKYTSRANAKTINVEIPMYLEEDMKAIAEENNCSIAKLMLQAIINYGIEKFPDKEDNFVTVSTINNTPRKKKNKKKTSAVPHTWSKEEEDYIKLVAPLNTYQQICNLVNEKFEENLTYTCVQQHMYVMGIKSGVKGKPGRKPLSSNTDASSSTNVIPKKMEKYYVDGMDELDVTHSMTKDDIKVEVQPVPTEVPEVSVVPVPVKTHEVSVEPAKEDTDEKSVYSTQPVKTNGEKQQKKYIIPQDIPKIVEKARKLTSATRYELNNCAIKYYLSKKTHVDSRLKLEKYADAMWINTKFVQPVIISMDYIDKLQTVAQQFECNISTIIIQAYLDYSSKIFEDFSIDFKYIFEKDLKHTDEY